MSSKRAARILNVADARRHARRALPRALYDYIEGGSDDEITLAENGRAFGRLEILPRMGIKIGKPDLATEVLGCRLELPVILAPCAFVEMMHPDGTAGVARAAAAAGTLAVLSRGALCRPREVLAGSPNSRWFQINGKGGREQIMRLMDEAAAAEYTVLVLTLDGPPSGNHERDVRNGMQPLLQVSPGLLARSAVQLLTRPRWAVGVAPSALRAALGRASPVGDASRVLTTDKSQAWPRFTWSTVEWIRGRWPGKLVVKGVLAAGDVAPAQEAGADAIIVSNHGGRQIDGVPAPISVLEEVVAAANPSIEVILDGGVRRGTDVIKAMSIGAKAVMIGRPYLYGLAAAGQPGVERVLAILREEIARALTLMGCGGVTSLSPNWLRLPPHEADRHVRASLEAESRVGIASSEDHLP